MSDGIKETRKFSGAGLNGTEYELMENYKEKGYTEMYTEAPYNWAMINYNNLKIITYSEGDVTLIECDDKKSFIGKVNEFIEWMNENEFNTEYVIEKIKKMEE